MIIASPKFILILVLSVGLLFLCPLTAFAHDDLLKQIIAVTANIKQEPKNPQLYLKRAELYRLHTEWKNAEKDILTAEKINPNLISVHLAMGKLMLDTENFSRSKMSLEKFLEKNPDNFEAVITLARVSVKLRQNKTAVNYFSRAIAIMPKNSAEIYLERTEVLINNKEFDEAISSLDAGIEKLGQMVILQSLAIDLEVKRKNYDAALSRVNKLMETMPRKETLQLKRGEILLQADRICEARDSFLASQKGFANLPLFRKNNRAVKELKTRLEILLLQTEKSCPQ